MKLFIRKYIHPLGFYNVTFFIENENTPVFQAHIVQNNDCIYENVKCG